MLVDNPGKARGNKKSQIYVETDLRQTRDDNSSVKPVRLLTGSVGSLDATFRLFDWNEFEEQLEFFELW